MADDRFSGAQILAEVQWRLGNLISGSGFSAYQMVFRTNPVDVYGWEDKDEDLTFARNGSERAGRRTSLAGAQLKLRMI